MAPGDSFATSGPRTETTTQDRGKGPGAGPGSVAVGEVVEVRADPVLMGAVVMAVQGSGDVVGRLPRQGTDQIPAKIYSKPLQWTLCVSVTCLFKRSYVADVLSTKTTVILVHS